MKFRVASLAALAAYANAECPKACSGHGECEQKNMCNCFNNWQGNDCSERTCYFGLAHVDTPKGDLNADGFVSGPLTTVITGSETYPWGTTEQYPNADANEGHFYMECSNKGICDRGSGECDCFDGYEGTACVRASCPNDCSGHGTCESIKELAEMKSYDTNAEDVPTTQPVGSDEHHNFDRSIEESYSYDLWDGDKTMGCKCDPVYYGADCSLKKCKYGVDPLFFDDSDGVIYQTTVLHLGAKGTAANDLEGTFNIIFYDVFGEKYTTKPISAHMGEVSAEKIISALEALPNDVINMPNTDVTRSGPDRGVSVSVQGVNGSLSFSGTHGAGQSGVGGGLGTYGAYGPEFTVTFATNPGILKTIELDTRQVSSVGTTDHWVANMRQGQFTSRYTDAVDPVNTLLYGSKFLYTSASPSSLSVAANDLVKVNGQEFMVEAVDEELSYLELNEPFLGSSILPILTDTGATVSAFDRTVDSMVFTLDIGSVTTANTDSLQEHSRLYAFGQPFVSKATPVISSLTLDIENTESTLYFNSDSHIIYRRTENPDNQNFYKAESDTAVKAVDTFCSTRGSFDIYPCIKTVVANEIVDLDVRTANYAGTVIGGTPKSVTFNAFPAVMSAADEGMFIGQQGPYKIESVDVDSLNVVFQDTNPRQQKFEDYFDADGTSSSVMPVYTVVTGDADISSGGVKMALINGRRYKLFGVETSLDGSGENEVKGTKVTLTETFSGQHLMQLCSDCVDSVGATQGSQQIVSIADGTALHILGNQALLIGGSVSYDMIVYANAEFLNVNGVYSEDLVVNTWKSTTAVKAAGNTAVNPRLALYTLTNQNGFTPIWITEELTQETYQYVAQCSNRGTCDSETGICACFPGYASDNCDVQNMVTA